MKLYFAKYIPIEGEIKEGDKVIDDNILSDNNIITISFDKYGTASDGRGTYSSERLKKLRKVKLFLCSRDIKVGDKVQFQLTKYSPWEETECIEVSDNHVIIKGKEHTYHTSADKMKQCFKLIGEISSEAIWVKEGDEFEEEEIQRDILTEWFAGEDDYTEFQHRYPKGDEVFILPKDEDFIIEYPIKIKCLNCETFH